MSAPQTFGHFLDPISPSDEFLTLNFSLSTQPRNQRWRNYGLSADFLGDYFSTFFPGETHGVNAKETIKASVSYIANELLENAVKYSDPSLNFPISITLRLYPEQIIFEVANPASQSLVKTYQAFIQLLLKSDPSDLYLKQLEATATGLGESHMGLLTMINDYEAQFGWRFTPMDDRPEGVWVTVRSTLEV
jgi:hypothetical protein